MTADSASQPFLSPRSIFQWCFGFAGLGALQYHSGIESGGLLIWAVSLLMALFPLASLRAPGEWRIDRLGAALALGVLWLLALEWLSVLPVVSFYSGLILAALPVGYCFVRITSPVVPGWRLETVLRILATPVLLLAVFEILLTHRRATSVFTDANLLAAFANLLFFPAWAQWLRAREARETPSLLTRAVAVLAVLTLAATTSASGFLCFVAALSLFTLASLRAVPRALPMAGAVLLGLGLASALAYRLDDSRAQPLSRIAAELRSSGHASDKESPFFSERRAMIRSALRIYADHAWYGTGPGTFKALYPPYRDRADVSTAGNFVHNDYVQALLEGGPFLLAFLLIPACVALASVWGAARSLWSTPEQQRIDAGALHRLACAAGVLAVAVQALSTFVFYTLTLSFLIGIHLALARRDESESGLRLGTLISLPALATLWGAMVFATLGTLGLRTAFVNLTDRQGCDLEMCRELRKDNRFMARYANILAATQPSWIYSRLYLIKLHTDSARASGTDSERQRFAALSAAESGRLGVEYPVLAEPYVQLAHLLADFPAAAKALPPGFPSDPETLNRQALTRDPFDFSAAAAAARGMMQRGAQTEALELLLESSTRLNAAVGTLAGRIEMLQLGLRLALSLGRCEPALDFAHLLMFYEPGNALAKAAIDSDRSDEASRSSSAGCGVPDWSDATPR